MPFIPGAEGARCLSFCSPYPRLLFSQKKLILLLITGVSLLWYLTDQRHRGHGGSAVVDSVASAFLLKLYPGA